MPDPMPETLHDSVYAALASASATGREGLAFGLPTIAPLGLPEATLRWLTDTAILAAARHARHGSDEPASTTRDHLAERMRHVLSVYGIAAPDMLVADLLDVVMSAAVADDFTLVRDALEDLVSLARSGELNKPHTEALGRLAPEDLDAIVAAVKSALDDPEPLVDLSDITGPAIDVSGAELELVPLEFVPTSLVRVLVDKYVAACDHQELLRLAARIGEQIAQGGC